MKSSPRGVLDRLEQTNQWVTYSRTKRLAGALGLWAWSGLLITVAVLVGRHDSAPRSWYVLNAASFMFFTSLFLQLALWPRRALKRALIVWFFMALVVIPVIALA